MKQRGLRARTLGAMAAAMLAGFLAAAPAHGQEPDSAAVGRGAFAGMQRVAGEVTAVSGSTVTLKAEDGSTVSVVTTDNTRVMKGRGNTVKVADLKVGDGVMAAGNLDAPNKTLHAAMLLATDAAQVKAMRENLGKTYIAGRVTAIDLDNAKMTVERADHVKQTIGFDETTSFRRGRRGAGGAGQGGFGGSFGGGTGTPTAAGTPTVAASPTANGTDGGRPAASPPAGESITLADVKVGDMVGGQGSLKAGVFVPTQLTVSTPGAGRTRQGQSGEGQPRAGQPAAGAGTPPPSR